jgi:hypothetical protein
MWGWVWRWVRVDGSTLLGDVASQGSSSWFGGLIVTDVGMVMAGLLLQDLDSKLCRSHEQLK